MSADPVRVKAIAALADGDKWALADLLAEMFSADEYGDGSMARSGLHDELAEYAVALRENHGVKLSTQTMRKMRATALAWSHGERSPCASYQAHELLRAVDGHERLIEKLIKRNSGRLTVDDVQRWRADQNPRPLVAWEAGAERKLRAVLHRIDARTSQARADLAAILDRLALELRA